LFVVRSDQDPGTSSRIASAGDDREFATLLEEIGGGPGPPGEVGRGDAPALPRARAEIRQLYEGGSPQAHRLRYGPVVFDLARRRSRAAQHRVHGTTCRNEETQCQAFWKPSAS
jgi:hypothetical protein